MDSKKRRTQDQSLVPPEDEPSARRQRVTAPQRDRKINHSSNIANSSTYNANFRRCMASWYKDVTRDITKQYKQLMAAYPIPANDAEAENSDPVWYLEDASEYVRRIGMAAYLYQGTTGDIVSFGQDDAYQLGRVKEFFTERQTEYLPGVIRGKLLKEVRHVTCGGLHSACVTADGEAYSWGSSDEGCLGRQSVDPEGEDNVGLAQCTPMVVTGFVTLTGENQDGTMVALSAGDVHTIFLSAEGDLFMTGMYKDMDSGKFAHPKTPNGSPVGFRDRPVQIPMPQKVIYVTSGQSFNAAILADGTMVTWGKLSQMCRTVVSMQCIRSVPVAHRFSFLILIWQEWDTKGS